MTYAPYPHTAEYDLTVTVKLFLRIPVEFPPGGADVEAERYVREDLMKQIKRAILRVDGDLEDSEYVIDSIDRAEVSR